MRQTRNPQGSPGGSRGKSQTVRRMELERALAELTSRQQEQAQQLRAARDYSRQLMQACPLPLLVLDAQRRITDLNAAAARLAGVRRQELLHSDFSSYFQEPDAARAALEQIASLGFLAGQALVLRHPSGDLSEVLLSGQARRDEKQNSLAAFVTMRDLSREKRHHAEIARLEAQLRASAAELQQRESEMQHVSKLYDVLQTCNAPQEAYPAVASVASRLFPGCSGALAVMIDGGPELETVAEWGTEALMLASFSLDDCWALRRGRLQEIQQPGTPLECRHFRTAPSGGYVCLPLSVRGEWHGLLHLRAAPGQRLTERDGRLLVTLGDVLKLSLSNVKLRGVLREQATRDPLTGLFNRLYLEEMLRRELSRSARRQTSLCVALLDIDGFKNFNDLNGHEAGDAVLKALGGFFQAKLRGSDIACRYGGDEFLLALLDTDVPHVLPRLEQIRGEIGRIEIAFEGSPLPTVSVSMGVAEWPGAAASLQQLIRAADRALYSAKTGGRNRIEIYGGSSSPAAPVHADDPAPLPAQAAR